MIVIVDKEWEGDDIGIDRVLFENIKDIYVEIGMGNMIRYE